MSKPKSKTGQVEDSCKKFKTMAWIVIAALVIGNLATLYFFTKFVNDIT